MRCRLRRVSSCREVDTWPISTIRAPTTICCAGSMRDWRAQRPSDLHEHRASPMTVPRNSATEREPAAAQASPPFRFYDNRQKYLAFVNTCNEKPAIARRVAQELAHIHPQPPSLRIFDAGMGDGTVLSRMMRSIHRDFPTVPMLAVAKEISLEDVRLGLDKMPDRFHEHPATVLVVTNLHYAEAPRLTPHEAGAPLNWQVVKLCGPSAHGWAEQIEGLSEI